jgi:hypothetical protein
MPILFLALIVGAGLGIFTFNQDYNADAGWIYLTYLSVSYGIFIAASFAIAIIGGVFARNSKVVRFKDGYGFSKFASVLLTLVTFSLFLLEFYKLIMLGGIGFWRTLRMFLSLGASVNFLFMSLRRRFVSKHISRNIRIGFSVITVFWAITSVFSIYFAQNSVALSNIVKILLLLSYVAITVFMFFEAKFKHISPSHIAYTISALVSAVFGCAICFPIAISIGLGKLVVDYTVMEFMVCFVVGIYAISRISAMIATIRYTIKTRSDNEDLPSSKSSKKATEEKADDVIVEEKAVEDEQSKAEEPKETPKKQSTQSHKAKYAKYPKSKKSGAKKSPTKRKK